MVGDTGSLQTQGIHRGWDCDRAWRLLVGVRATGGGREEGLRTAVRGVTWWGVEDLRTQNRELGSRGHRIQTT